MFLQRVLMYVKTTGKRFMLTFAAHKAVYASPDVHTSRVTFHVTSHFFVRVTVGRRGGENSVLVHSVSPRW